MIEIEGCVVVVPSDTGKNAPEQMAAPYPIHSDRGESRWLNSGDQFFERTLAAIAGARSSIWLETYIYAVGFPGNQIRDALLSALQRGVEVKVLLDGWGSLFLPNHFWGGLEAAGGEVRWFNPLSLRRYGIRNHRKLLVCDGTTAFVGGINIAPEWAGDGVTHGWRDLGLEVHGRVAEELGESFHKMFLMAPFRHKRFLRLRRTALRKTVRTGEGLLLLSGPGRGRNPFSEAIVKDLAAARSVKILSAYFLPSGAIRRALMRCARSGCPIEIILAGRSDVPLAQLASRRLYQPLMRAGVQILEYQPQILHAKLLVIDDIVYVGSANLDRRSLQINYELMLRISSRTLADQARSFFSADAAVSRRIDPLTWPQSRNLWSKLLERWAFFLLTRLDPLMARRQLRNLR